MGVSLSNASDRKCESDDDGMTAMTRFSVKCCRYNAKSGTLQRLVWMRYDHLHAGRRIGRYDQSDNWVRTDDRCGRGTTTTMLDDRLA